MSNILNHVTGADKALSPQDKTEIRKQAEIYRDRGWVPIPVIAQDKKPCRTGWPNSTINSSLDDFANDNNIAILLGDPSGGLVDIDLDCEEAVIAAKYLLPSTDLIFGPANDPRSHYLYQVVEPGDPEKWAFKRDCIVEYRANRTTTVFPPSRYPDGGHRIFSRDGEPSLISAHELKLAASKTAAAALLAKHWSEGGRHDLSLPLAGALANGGWEQEDAENFMAAVCEAGGDEESSKRLENVRTSFDQYRSGQPVTGVPTLEHGLGPDITRRVCEWLGLGSARPSIGHNGPPMDDNVRFTDIGNTDRFVEEHGAEVSYCPEIGWLVWNGVAWVPDDTSSVIRYAEQTIRGIVVEARQIGRGHLGSRASVASVVELAKARLSEGINIFDQSDWLLNCPNGTVDLKSGKLLPHSRSDKITKVTKAPFEPDAPCPQFETFMNEIMKGNQDNVEFLRRAFGYSLTGSTSEQCLFVLHGSGANGKSTLTNLFEYLLGDYASNSPAQTFLVKKHDGGVPNDIARLRGARLVTASETDDAGQRLAVSLLKRLTGGDTMTARYLHKEFFSFTPKLKLWVPTNHKPTFNGADEAMGRRIHLIPFDYVVPKDKRDGNLPERLKAEGRGILSWAVKGCLDWQREGLNPPEAIRQATKGYLAEMDVVGQFLDDATQRHSGAKIPKSEAYERFLGWARRSGQEELSMANFNQGMKASGLHDGKNGSKGRYWKDIQLMSDLAEAEPGLIEQPAGW